MADIIEYPAIFSVKRFIEIVEMVVRKDQRRKDIGKTMLKDEICLAKEKGITRIECKVAIKKIQFHKYSGRKMDSGCIQKSNVKAYHTTFLNSSRYI